MIVIRIYKKEDVPGFYQAVIESKPEVSRWLPWCKDNYSIKHTEEWITKTVPHIWASKKGCEFVIADTAQNKIVGGCCIEQLNLHAKEANIAYWIRTSETGKGIATKASHFLLRYGFEELLLDTIKVIVSVVNIGSVRVGEKLPYEDLLKVKNGFQIREDISDALVYRITRKSYENYSKKKR